MKTVINHNVRFASEIGPEGWELANSEILQLVQKVAKHHFGGEEYSFQRGKLNIYGPGGFFLEHRDSPTSTSTMIATLVICLPTRFTGGELIVKNGLKEIVFDFANHEDNVQFAVFYSDCIHEVKPVTSGHRITLTYYLHVPQYNGPHHEYVGYSYDQRIHAVITHKGSVNINMENINDLTENLLRLSCSGVQIGLVLSHKYPTDSMEPHCLKGCDRLLYDLLLECYKSIKLYPVILKTHIVTYTPEDWDAELEEDSTGHIFPFTREHYEHFCKLVEIGRTDHGTSFDIDRSKLKNLKLQGPKKEFSHMVFFAGVVGGHLLKNYENPGSDYVGNEAEGGFLECTYFTTVMIPQL